MAQSHIRWKRRIGSMLSWRRRWSRRGVISVYSALILLIIMGSVAVTVDWGLMWNGRQQLQDAVDAAALAGASSLQFGMDPAAARTAAIAAANNNMVLNQPLILAEQDIEVGAWDPDTHQIVPWSPAFTETAVRVTGRRTVDSPNGPIPLFFSYIFGRQHVEMAMSGAAGIATYNGPRKPVEIIVAQDASSSFIEEWRDAIDADWAMFNLINGASVDDDKLGYVAFNEGLKMSNQYYMTYEHGWWTYAPKPTYKTMTSFGGSRTQLPSDWRDHKTFVRNDGPRGYTNPSAALNWAIQEYAARGDDEKCQQSIVLVSDGMPFGQTAALTQQYRNQTVAKANEAGNLGIRIHTVTLTSEADGAPYGSGGADFQFNESLVRNGGSAFRTADPEGLMDVLIQVGTIEIGKAHLFM